MRPVLNLLRFNGNYNTQNALLSQMQSQQFRGFYMNSRFNQSMFANIANSKSGCSSCGK